MSGKGGVHMRRQSVLIYVVLIAAVFLSLSWTGTAFCDERSHDRSHEQERKKGHEKGGIRGTITCDAGGPVAGAIVAVTDSDLKDTTDSKGHFRIHHVHAGTYTLTVTVNGTVVKTLTTVAVSRKKTTNIGKVSIVCSQTCTASTDCPAGNYCATTAGSCGTSGSCATTPISCTEIYDPVCGCDGVTYSNDCVAALAGANLLFKGACQITPPPPVSCADNSQCGSGEYCVKAVGSCPDQGTCGSRPIGCLQNYDPVCGCDGSTYANECEAAVAGVSVTSLGACVVMPPQPTACLDNSQCTAGEYCTKGLGDCTGQGSCTARPSLCVQAADPVCGCNGTTYSSECEAAVSGIAIASKGNCAAPPAPTGCITNVECLSTQYCAKTSGDCEGTGACSQRPGLCLSFYNPVLGCDGNSYANSCEAAAAGINLQ